MSYENVPIGKGNRPHRNVSTPAYRDGWTEIFKRRVKLANGKTAAEECETCGRFAPRHAAWCGEGRGN